MTLIIRTRYLSQTMSARKQGFAKYIYYAINPCIFEGSYKFTTPISGYVRVQTVLYLFPGASIIDIIYGNY